MQNTWRVFVALAAVFVGAVLSTPIRRSTTGKATFYNPGGALGACGNPIQDSDHAVALATDSYAGGAHCGKNINVQYNGASLVLKVVDLCPGCTAGGLDLTAGSFAQIADPGLGHVDVQWAFA
ncbi:Non-catalytic module family EXPN protein [Mycena crocata]|nr:Non-catalytic module family EXPN protein [Mycena crocata]